MAYDAFAWLSIHGVTELSAICIACAGGVQLGLAVLMPGQMTRKDALRIRGRDATKLLILAAVMLLVAAILEGFFRQLVQSAELRLLIGWGIGGLWVRVAGAGGPHPGGAFGMSRKKKTFNAADLHQAEQAKREKRILRITPPEGVADRP